MNNDHNIRKAERDGALFEVRRYGELLDEIVATGANVHLEDMGFDDESGKHSWNLIIESAGARASLFFSVTDPPVEYEIIIPDQG